MAPVLIVASASNVIAPLNVLVPNVLKIAPVPLLPLPAILQTRHDNDQAYGEA